LTFFINSQKIGLGQPVYAPQQPVYAPQQPVYAPQQPVYAPQQPDYAPPKAYEPQLEIVEYAKPEPVHKAEPEHELEHYQQAEEELESAKMNDPNMPQTYDF
jgi:hypothetical protein